MAEQLGKIWVFDQTKLDHALEQYQQAALKAYPHQQERIDITVLAVKDFLLSEFAEKLTMSINKQ